jgi:hypothetical protein
MCLLFALLFFLTLVLFGLLLPLWAIFDCMLSNALEQGAKLGWILAMVFLWGFGALAYGCTSSRSESLRTASMFCALLMRVGVVFASVTTGTRVVHETLTQGVSSGYVRASIN